MISERLEGEGESLEVRLVEAKDRLASEQGAA